jgi:glycosyltransferase involved in cell wall biosynthesis
VVRIVADEFPEWAADEGVETVRWRAEREVREIAAFTVGLMPLADDVWTRGKCGFKILQYYSCGAPTVASPVGVNTEIVEPGTTGELASTDEEWLGAIERITGDRALRAEMGRAARARAERDYAVKAWGPCWARWVADAVR